MSDRDPKKERVFGCGSQDAAPRLKGRAIIDESIAQGVSSTDFMRRRRETVTPGTGNLPNAN